MYHYKNVVRVPPMGMIDDICSISKCGTSSIVLNATINNKVESKRLEFGAKKCFQIHVGKNSRSCPSLKVHQTRMTKTTSERYLGDTIDQGLNHDITIQKRCNSAIGTISDILVILSQVSQGHQYIHIGLIMREAILVSKLLLNVEVWPKLTKALAIKFEQTDLALQRKLLNCPVSTNFESIYSELNTMPLSIIIMKRRLMYHWNIVNRNKDELVNRIYRAQKFSQSKSDLYQLILKDKKMLKIQLTDEDLCKISKNQYKCFINEKIKIYRRIVLTEMQASKSKSRDLNMNSNETAKYLLNNKFSLELAQLCFSLRSRTYCSKDNYRNKYKNDDIFCEAC